MTTNTINSSLIVDAMRGAVIGTLHAQPINIKEIFTLDSTPEAIMGGKAEVPYVETANVSASTYAGGTYANSNLEVSSKTVSLIEKYIEFVVPSYEQQGYGIDAAKTVASKVTEKLVQTVEADIYSVITAQNFANKEVVAEAANCSSYIVGELRTSLVKKNVINPAMVLEPDYMANLMGDIVENQTASQAVNELNQNGVTAYHRGVRLFESNNLGNLKGFACGKDAVLIKNVGVFAEAGVYDVVESFKDEKTGLVFSLVKFANPSRGGMSWRLVCRYGKAVGNANALYRVAVS